MPKTTVVPSQIPKSDDLLMTSDDLKLLFYYLGDVNYISFSFLFILPYKL